MTYRSTFIQSNLTYQNHPISVNLIAKKFNTFMLAGKVNTALRLVSETESGGILPTSEQTIDHLKKKNDHAGASKFDAFYDDYMAWKNYMKNIHMKKHGVLIYKIACEIKGAAGLLNLDVNGWSSILTSLSFGDSSQDLCSAIALMAKKLCLKKYYGNDGSLEAFLICKLIPLDKNPGVKPIGILGLRILGRTVMRTFKKKRSRNCT